MKIEAIINQPVIETERFTLRPLRRSDAGLLAMYAGDRRVAEGTRSIPHPLPPGAIEAFITRSTADDRIEDVWVMDGTAHGGPEVQGVISLKPEGEGRSVIGYWVAPLFWNTGLASEAVAALLAANPQNCKTIFAEVFQDNPASARVLTNAGFAYIGDAETYSVARGANVPTWTYLKKLA
ncbi:Acetyltransferase (GNAT) family protein [Pseudoruegeria aquimaris]|uniref:Acetyltransferase (GNAT) family protein n=1 Tax=Pseudoruegeria aquimaris TaxID=393663 RepID=A0A1Y5RJA8_9RHOB|nr:GNAT family N-acetyltransferase [Pseudoruegeria aquimaris]SLN18933.1 Acetyltransferase (GNAT) family protein [Pseudoruegeria aquimaris]